MKVHKSHHHQTFFWTDILGIQFKQWEAQLPIQVNPTFPPFELLIGQPSSENGCKLSMIYDSSTALNVGFSDFHLVVSNAYPELVIFL